jgi:DNA-binding NtrC family response regulator
MPFTTLSNGREAWRRGTGDELVLSLVAITEDEEFYCRLRGIAGSCQWRIVRARSIEEAETAILQKPTPLVVYESDPNDAKWRFALRRLSELTPHPCVLLASAVADENLLRDVVRNNGYDILPKSVSREKTIRVLTFAWFWALASSSERGRR